MKRPTKLAPMPAAKRILEPAATLAEVRGGDGGTSGNSESRNIEFEMIKS